jgi:hypothetical protein
LFRPDRFVNSFANGPCVGRSRNTAGRGSGRITDCIVLRIPPGFPPLRATARYRTQLSHSPVTMPAHQRATDAGVGARLAGHAQGLGTRAEEALAPHGRFHSGEGGPASASASACACACLKLAGARTSSGCRGCTPGDSPPGSGAESWELEERAGDPAAPDSSREERHDRCRACLARKWQE